MPQRAPRSVDEGAAQAYQEMQGAKAAPEAPKPNIDPEIKRKASPTTYRREKAPGEAPPPKPSKERMKSYSAGPRRKAAPRGAVKKSSLEDFLLVRGE